MLLLLIVGTGIFYNYVKFPAISSTESRLNAFPTNDFYTAIYYRTEQLIKGEKMDISVVYPHEIDASGQALPLLFSPFLLFFKPDRYVAYFFFLGITAVMYILFYVFLMRKLDKHILNAGLIFLIAFFLSEPGLVGIYMGNIDILLAPLVGILILTFFHFMKKKSISFIQFVDLGVLMGILINIKITLLPFVLVAVIFSKRIYITALAMLITFLSLVYVPNVVGSKSSLVLYFSNILKWNSIHPFSYFLWSNHSIYVIASFFTNCMDKNICDTQFANRVIALFLLLFTFVMPFLLALSMRKIVINKNIFLSLRMLRINNEFALVLFVLSVAFINLAFKVVYDYRLFYSLIITLILLRESARFKRALVYCYLSMFSLLLGGIWALQLSPNEPWTIDARLLKGFIIFHFFFLILSAITYWKESQKKRLQNLEALR
jgi:hypothetical protein